MGGRRLEGSLVLEHDLGQLATLSGVEMAEQSAEQPASEKSTAFYLSLLAPGAGQLYARQWSCVPWFLATGLIATLAACGNAYAWSASAWIQFLSLAVLGLASAEHAKRCLEPSRRPRGAPAVPTRVRCSRLRGAIVDLQIELEVPQPPAEVWAVVRDMPRFACVDPFHQRVIVLGPALKPGVELVLEHCAFGIRFRRFGRLLSWHEGRGYGFSDLSARGPGQGFPHAFFVTVTAAGLGKAERTRLLLRVRGKWTSRFVPLWLGQWWLRYVCAEHARLLRATFQESG